MSDSELDTGWARYQLPVLLTGGLVLYGASRFDGTRAVAGMLLTYGFPLLALFIASAPLRESSLFPSALTVGGIAAGAAELAIGHALMPKSELFALVPGPILAGTSVVALLLAAVVQARAAGRGMRNTFAAWMGMVTMVALYLPGHARAGKDSLDAFVAALLVSLFVGGGAGLMLGGVATRLLKKNPPPERKRSGST
ncbi:MAG: hypothetical protein IPI67_21810 [Myxococcales bacterium]|nr:hypothetical protein [Myxococcales bacterium]